MNKITDTVALISFGALFLVALSLVIISVVLAIKINKTFKENKRDKDTLDDILDYRWNEKFE